MRLARTRRALGPLEAPLVEAYRWARGRVNHWMRPAVVVLAADGDHLEEADELVGRLGRSVGFWVTTADDVAPYASRGWFVLRFDPDTWSDEQGRQRVEAIGRHLRVRRVIDLAGTARGPR